MKKAIGSFSILLMLINYAHAQENNENLSFKNYFHVGFFQFFNGTFYLGYERVVTEKSSVFLSGGVTLVDQSHEERIGGQANAEYRIYALLGDENDSFIDFNGIYVGPYVKYKTVQITEIDDPSNAVNKKSNFETVGGGVLVGIKVTVTDKIFFDFNLGGGIQYEFSEDDENNYWSNDIYSPGYTGVLPAGNFTFGLQF